MKEQLVKTPYAVSALCASPVDATLALGFKEVCACYVYERACMCVRECVCVCARERERERESVFVCVCLCAYAVSALCTGPVDATLALAFKEVCVCCV